MKNWRFLTEHFGKFVPVLEAMIITQNFGENRVDFYKKMGLIGHNGIDYRAREGDPTYSAFDGTVVYSGKDGDGGQSVRVQTDEKNINGLKYKLESISYHLNKCLVRKGETVKAGDLIGETGNTGKYSTGPHLHWGLKVMWYEKGQWQKDYENGYRGAIDPSPFFEGVGEFPVTRRYGREQNWLAEFNMRFKNQWLHRKFYKELKRHPLSITDQELFALVYGGWDYQTVFLHPEMFEVWGYKTKHNYLNK